MKLHDYLTLTVLAGLLLVPLVPDSLHAQVVIGGADNDGVVGDGRVGADNSVFSHWMFSRRKGDPLAMRWDGSKRLYFREKRVAVKSHIGDAPMSAVTRFREVPLEQILDTNFIDLTNEHLGSNPLTPNDERRFYFTPLGYAGAHSLAPGSAEVWDRNNVRKPTDKDVVMHYNRHLPWDLTKEGTMMRWVAEQIKANIPSAATDNGVLFIDARNDQVEAKLGGEFARVQSKLQPVNQACQSRLDQIIAQLRKEIAELEQAKEALLEEQDGYNNYKLVLIKQKSQAVSQALSTVDTDNNIRRVNEDIDRVQLEIDKLDEAIAVREKEIAWRNTQKKLCQNRFVADVSTMTTVVPGGTVLNLREVVRHQGEAKVSYTSVDQTIAEMTTDTEPDIKDFDHNEPPGLVVAYASDGKKPLILTKTTLLAGPLQIVSDSLVVVCGSLGWKEEAGVWGSMSQAYKWAETLENHRWRIIAPNVQFGSVISLDEIKNGTLFSQAAYRAQEVPPHANTSELLEQKNELLKEKQEIVDQMAYIDEEIAPNKFEVIRKARETNQQYSEKLAELDPDDPTYAQQKAQLDQELESAKALLAQVEDGLIPGDEQTHALFKVEANNMMAQIDTEVAMIDEALAINQKLGLPSSVADLPPDGEDTDAVVESGTQPGTGISYSQAEYLARSLQ